MYHHPTTPPHLQQVSRVGLLRLLERHKGDVLGGQRLVGEGALQGGTSVGTNEKWRSDAARPAPGRQAGVLGEHDSNQHLLVCRALCHNISAACCLPPACLDLGEVVRANGHQRALPAQVLVQLVLHSSGERT